jgi:hypothetical protein
VPIVLKSGNLNLLEPSGPLKACNGIVLPLSIHETNLIYKLRIAKCGFSLSLAVTARLCHPEGVQKLNIKHTAILQITQNFNHRPRFYIFAYFSPTKKISMMPM